MPSNTTSPLRCYAITIPHSGDLITDFIFLDSTQRRLVPGSDQRRHQLPVERPRDM